MGCDLSTIAKQFYGDPNKKIFEANREVIKDADLIFPELQVGSSIKFAVPADERER